MTWYMKDEFRFRYAVLEDTRKMSMWKCLVAIENEVKIQVRSQA